MSTSIANYHVHHNSDSDHVAQYWWPTDQGKGIADQFHKSHELDGLVSPFPVAGWNDEHKVVQLVSILMSSL